MKNLYSDGIDLDDLDENLSDFDDDFVQEGGGQNGGAYTEKELRFKAMCRTVGTIFLVLCLLAAIGTIIYFSAGFAAAPIAAVAAAEAAGTTAVASSAVAGAALGTALGTGAISLEMLFASIIIGLGAVGVAARTLGEDDDATNPRRLQRGGGLFTSSKKKQKPQEELLDVDTAITLLYDYINKKQTRFLILWKRMLRPIVKSRFLSMHSQIVSRFKKNLIHEGKDKRIIKELVRQEKLKSKLEWDRISSCLDNVLYTGNRSAIMLVGDVAGVGGKYQKFGVTGGTREQRLANMKQSLKEIFRKDIVDSIDMSRLLLSTKRLKKLQPHLNNLTSQTVAIDTAVEQSLKDSAKTDQLNVNMEFLAEQQKHIDNVNATPLVNDISTESIDEDMNVLRSSESSSPTEETSPTEQTSPIIEEAEFIEKKEESSPAIGGKRKKTKKMKKMKSKKQRKSKKRKSRK